MSIYSTFDYLFSQGAKDGSRRGSSDGACRQLAKLIRRHGKRAFGELTPEQREILVQLETAGQLAELERIRDGLAAASGWGELLPRTVEAGTVEPDPEYLLPFEFDPTPMAPSIDTYAKAKSVHGAETVVHMRFQRVYQENLGEILYQDSERLREKYQATVQTLVMLLWPGADGPGVTGTYKPRKGAEFRYHLARLWERDAEEMASSPGMAMFAPLGRGAEERLPGIVSKMAAAITEAGKDDPHMAEDVWVVAYFSMGLRYTAERVNEVLADFLPDMYKSRDFRSALSQGYYAGLNRSRNDGAMEATRDWVLTLGSCRLGEPPPHIRKGLEANRNLDRLEQIAGRVLKCSTWAEALAMN
jgi:hypothetical protein